MRVACVAGIAALAAGLASPPARAVGLRPLSPDRPGDSDSPITVDAEHTQVETELAQFTWQPGPNGLALFTTAAKFGITDRVDAQLVVAPYRRGVGFDDLTLRVKVNIWSSEAGAAALIPFVDLNGERAGMNLPVAVALPAGLGLSCMIEAVSDGAAAGTVGLSHALAGPLAAYADWAVDEEEGTFSEHAQAGTTLLLGGDVQLDAEVIAALPHPDRSLGLAVGVTVRR